MSQFVAEEPQVPIRMKREVAWLKRKVNFQAQKLNKQEETTRALRTKLRRYENAESNNIRDEIFDENVNLISSSH